MERCLVGRSLHHHDVWSFALAAIAGALLLAGLWTPIAAAVLALFEISIAFRTAGDPSPYLLIAAIAIGLAALGPGSWSIDARLFGRRRISIENR
jgi:uncharacterized membrane protein YphA (DoxX/SURF4 family)